MQQLPSLVWFAPIALLFIALLDLPYGYYQFLRLVVFVAALAIAAQTWHRGTSTAVCLLGLAILYNPLYRVHFERSTWEVINVATALGLISHWLLVGRKS